MGGGGHRNFKIGGRGGGFIRQTFNMINMTIFVVGGVGGAGDVHCLLIRILGILLTD